MTTAICLYCGEFKFGAFAACANCNNLTRNVNLDLGFSDWCMSEEKLQDYSNKIKNIYALSKSYEITFFTFIEYLKKSKPEAIESEPPVKYKEIISTILSQIDFNEHNRCPHFQSKVDNDRQTHLDKYTEEENLVYLEYCKLMLTEETNKYCCRTCNNTGEIIVECEECDGTGINRDFVDCSEQYDIVTNDIEDDEDSWIADQLEFDYDDHMSNNQNCPFCDGSKYIKIPCPDCSKR